MPETAKLLAHFHAAGAQVYVCAQGQAAGFAWTLEKPDATLYDEKGQSVGTHGAGPTWTSIDGSSVVAKKVAQADAPSPGAISWLLLRADKTAGSGVLSHVGYVQRVSTKDGQPPGAKCDAGVAGSHKRSNYTAEYFFYAGR